MGGIVENLAGILTGQKPEAQVVRPTTPTKRSKASAAQRRQSLRKADEGKGSTSLGRKTLLGQ